MSCNKYEEGCEETTLASPDLPEAPKPCKKSGKKGAVTAAAIAAVLLTAASIACALYFTGDSYRCKKDMKQAQKCFEAGEYEDAVKLLKERLQKNGEENKFNSLITDKLAEIYLAQSDFYLMNGDCLSAVQTLVDGGQVTGAAELSEREAYLWENIVVTSRKCYRDGDIISEWQYDTNGNRIKSVFYNEDGSVDGYTEYTYDELENEVKEIYYNGDGSVDGYAEYIYDASGNKVKEILYDGDGNVSCSTEYDILGNQVKVVDGDKNLLDEYIYEYAYRINRRN